MIRTLPPADFLTDSSHFPVVDVRSPGEFACGHIPGAFSIPLFDDAERAVIGTIYRHNGREAAITRGLQIAGPKTTSYLSEAKSVVHGKDMLIHCWRGGLRSEKMAGLYDQHGFNVGILRDGYKGYRKFIRETFTGPLKVMVLGGYTGSGKTEILKAMARSGEQFIDLEEVAHHKGSVFGALGQSPQPTNEQFGNDLFEQWKKIERDRPVWLEDESRMIGAITLPEPVILKINHAVMVRVVISRQIRIERLVSEYSAYDPVLLHDAVGKIRERLGGAKANEADSAIDRKDFVKVAEITLSYYDKAYDHAMARRGNTKVYSYVPHAEEPGNIAVELILLFKDLIKNDPDLFRL